MIAATVGIVGTGLIGASIGLRARELEFQVLGFDADPHHAQTALERGALTAIATKAQLYEQSTIIVLAPHLQATLEELQYLSNHASSASLIIDVASVKSAVVSAARTVRNFVASHPMAGSERSGPTAADAALFFRKPWLYVPTADAALNERAVRFIGSLGGIPSAVDAEQHDRIVALTSHLPQAFANMFAARVHALDIDPGPYCGPTARELQRLAKSSDAMWTDIFQANKANIARELQGIARDLSSAADRLERGEDSWLAR
jgi:prephenate dehydrogenase